MTVAAFSGNLALEPEFKVGESGKLSAHLRIAISDGYRNRHGEWVSRESIFWNAYAWGEAAENLKAAQLHKGDAVVCEARIDASSWTDDSGLSRTRLFLTILSLGRNILRPRSKDKEPQTTPYASAEVEQYWHNDAANQVGL